MSLLFSNKFEELFFEQKLAGKSEFSRNEGILKFRPFNLHFEIILYKQEDVPILLIKINDISSILMKESLNYGQLKK